MSTTRRQSAYKTRVMDRERHLRVSPGLRLQKLLQQMSVDLDGVRGDDVASGRIDPAQLNGRQSLRRREEGIRIQVEGNGDAGRAGGRHRLIDAHRLRLRGSLTATHGRPLSYRVLGAFRHRHRFHLHGRIHSRQDHGAVLLLEQLILARRGRIRLTRVARRTVGFAQDESHGRGGVDGGARCLVHGAQLQNAAFEGFDDMRGHVALAMTGSTEAQIAVRALEGLGTGMQSHVDLETAAGGEQRATNVAAYVLGRRVVRPGVSVQRRLDGEGFAA